MPKTAQKNAVTKLSPFAWRHNDGHGSKGLRFDRISRSTGISSDSIFERSNAYQQQIAQRPGLKELVRISDISALINTVRVEHGQENWDGYGASPVNAESLNYADQFLRQLKTFVPLPLVGCEPSGRVGIEWITDTMRLSVAFNPDGSITFAGINRHGRLFNGRNRQDLEARIKPLIPVADAYAFA